MPQRAEADVGELIKRPNGRTLVLGSTIRGVVAVVLVVGALTIGNATSSCGDDIDPDDAYEAGPDGIEGTADDRPDAEDLYERGPDGIEGTADDRLGADDDGDECE